MHKLSLIFLTAFSVQCVVVEGGRSNSSRRAPIYSIPSAFLSMRDSLLLHKLSLIFSLLPSVSNVLWWKEVGLIRLAELPIYSIPSAFLSVRDSCFLHKLSLDFLTAFSVQCVVVEGGRSYSSRGAPIYSIPSAFLSVRDSLLLHILSLIFSLLPSLFKLSSREEVVYSAEVSTSELSFFQWLVVQPPRL